MGTVSPILMEVLYDRTPPLPRGKFHENNYFLIFRLLCVSFSNIYYIPLKFYLICNGIYYKITTLYHNLRCKQHIKRTGHKAPAVCQVNKVRLASHFKQETSFT